MFHPLWWAVCRPWCYVLHTQARKHTHKLVIFRDNLSGGRGDIMSWRGTYHWPGYLILTSHSSQLTHEGIVIQHKRNMLILCLHSHRFFRCSYPGQGLFLWRLSLDQIFTFSGIKLVSRWYGSLDTILSVSLLCVVVCLRGISNHKIKDATDWLLCG